MIGMTILILQDQVQMQCKLDLLQHGPVQPRGALRHGYMLAPLFFTELLNHRMKSTWKPVSLEPLIKQGSGLGHPVTAARNKRACCTGRRKYCCIPAAELRNVRGLRQHGPRQNTGPEPFYRNLVPGHGTESSLKAGSHMVSFHN